jgi:hypothetical protein
VIAFVVAITKTAFVGQFAFVAANAARVIVFIVRLETSALPTWRRFPNRIAAVAAFANLVVGSLHQGLKAGAFVPLAIFFYAHLSYRTSLRQSVKGCGV